MESANRIIVWVFYAAFGLLGIVLAAGGRFIALAVCYGVAAIGFASVTVMRKAIAAPRPYQDGGQAPRIVREEEGRFVSQPPLFFGVSDSFLVGRCRISGGVFDLADLGGSAWCSAGARRRSLPQRCCRGLCHGNPIRAGCVCVAAMARLMAAAGQHASCGVRLAQGRI